MGLQDLDQLLSPQERQASEKKAADEQFEKERDRLHTRLIQARNTGGKKHEQISLNQLGKLCSEHGDYEWALDYYQRAYTINKEDNHTLGGLGLTCYRMGNYDQAIKWYEKQLTLYPSNEQALDGLAATYRKKGDHNTAIKLYKKLLALYPGNKQALDGLGITYREMGFYDAAIEWYKKKLALYPGDKQALAGLGIIYREMGSYDRAIEYYKEILMLHPGNKHAMDGLAITYLKKGDYDSSVKLYQKLLALYPDDEYALGGLVLTYARMGATPQAVEILKRRLHTEPQNGFALSRLLSISETYKADNKLRKAQDILDFLQEIQAEDLFSVTLQEVDLDIEAELPRQKIERLEKVIERQKAELLRSRRFAMLGVMASGTAHAIAQPLQIILAQAQNCQKDVQLDIIDKDGIIKDLKEIVRNTQRIDKIINHLHLFSRERRPELKVVDVNVVIEDALLMFQQQLKARGIEVRRDMADDLLSVRADQVQLEQVFINLITNARDALKDRKFKCITITTRTHSDKVDIRFKDSGMGIASQDLPHIFDAFYTTKEKGLGLGLYIAKDIVHSYGGTIRVVKTSIDGTTFSISLPAIKEEKI